MSNSRRSHLERLAALRAIYADAVRERAAIIWEGCPGMTWDAADDLAFEQEAHAQRRLFE